MVKERQVCSLVNHGSEGCFVFAPELNGVVVKEKTERLNLPKVKDEGRER